MDELRKNAVKARSLLGLAVALMAASPAQASTLWCTSSVSQVALTPDGQLIVLFDGIGWPRLCNVNQAMATSMGSITPDTCKGWLSMFLTAKASKQNMTFAIDYGASAAPSTCQNLPNFSWQVPAVFPYWINFAG